MKWNQGEFTITDNREDLDIETIHNFLCESYWAKNIPKPIVEKAATCFLLVAAPVSAHLIGRAAYRSGIRIWERSRRNHLSRRRGACKCGPYGHHAQTYFSAQWKERDGGNPREKFPRQTQDRGKREDD